MRLLRNLALEFHHIARGSTHEHSKLRSRLATALIATVVFDIAMTFAVYGLEHGKQGSQITSWFTGFFWVTTQLLTVSSQMPNPVTTGGRIADIFLELWALTVVTTLAGSFAAFLAKR